jgi:hypothetical protein
VPRTIYGPTREKEGWRIKHSYEPYDLYNTPEMVKIVKLERLWWVGYLTRANDTFPCRKLFFPSPKAQGGLEGSPGGWTV